VLFALVIDSLTICNHGLQRRAGAKGFGLWALEDIKSGQVRLP
jgi:hypothetical protein